MKNGFVSGIKVVRTPWTTAGVAAGLITSLIVASADAAEVAALSWVDDANGHVIDIEVDGQPPYTTAILDDGRRLRVTFEETSLGREAADIEARGNVKGVFPYLANDGNSVHVDILMDSSGGLSVESTDAGYRIVAETDALDETSKLVAQSRNGELFDDAALTNAIAEIEDAEKALEVSDRGQIPEQATHTEESVQVADGDTDSATTPDLVNSELRSITDAMNDGVDANRDDDKAATADAGTSQPAAASDEPAGAGAADESIAAGATDVIDTDGVDAEPNFSAEPATVIDPGEAVAAAPSGQNPAADGGLLEQPGAPVASDDDGGILIGARSASATGADVTAPSPEMETPEMETVGLSATVAGGNKPAQTVPSEIPLETVVLNDIQYSPLPGGRVQVDLHMTGRPGEPGSFSTAQPARLALDFFNTKVAMRDRSIDVKSGALDSIAAIQTDDRTRLVLNLVRPVSYETEARENGMTIILESATGSAVRAGGTRVAQFAEKAERTAKHSVTRIDFRRDVSGGGKIIVDLSDPKIGVDVREEAGDIVVDFINTSLPPELERRLDVVDFATPVQTIDAFNQGDHSRLIITPLGRFRQLAYQTGNVFTVAVSPITKEEDEAEQVDEFGYSGEKLSLNFQKISVRAALQVIADFTGLNFVTSDSVKGSLTLRLQDVPWDQALDIILQTKGLDKRQKGNVVWVAPAEEITAKERQALEANQLVAELEPLVSELIQVNYAKATDLADLLKSIKAIDVGVENNAAFSPLRVEKVETDSNTLLSPRGQVTVDERTNTLLVQDTANKIKEIRKLIAKLDVPVRQVLVETRIVEATDDFSKVLGARLGMARVTENARLPGATNSNIGDVTVSGNLEDVVSITPNDPEETGEHIVPDGLMVDLPAIGLGNERAASIGAIISKIGAGYVHLIDLELSALQQEGSGKIIANPKVMTANQQEAIIKSGQEQFFAPVGFNTKPTRDEAVLQLKVTPQITPDDRMVLDVEIKQDRFISTGLKNKKEIVTQVLLENGETVVIGGVYQEELQSTVTKTPILGDVPVLGNLFKKKQSLDDRKELLIFLTPRILDSALSLR